MNLKDQVFQSLVEHYEETGDALGHIPYLVERGLSAGVITDAYHQFRDWLEEENDLLQLRNWKNRHKC